METERTRRFLDAFEGIAGFLRRAVTADRSVSFGELVTRAADKSPAVRTYGVDLREFSDLRNAIVHERGDGHALAEPYEGTVEKIEEIRRFLETPPFALNVVPVPRVETCAPEETIGKAARQMFDGSFSQLPVYEAGRLTALLTAETIARWVGSRLASGVGLLEEEPIGSVLPFTEDPDNHRLVPRTFTVFDALDLFADYTRRGKYLDAILITHNGKPTDTPLAIVTTFDIPKLTAAVAR